MEINLIHSEESLIFVIFQDWMQYEEVADTKETGREKLTLY